MPSTMLGIGDAMVNISLHDIWQIHGGILSQTGKGEVYGFFEEVVLELKAKGEMKSSG